LNDGGTLVGWPLEDRRAGLGRELVPRGVEVEAELVAQPRPSAGGSSRRRGAWLHGWIAPLAEGSPAWSGDDQLGGRTSHPGCRGPLHTGPGTERAVERERAGARARRCRSGGRWGRPSSSLKLQLAARVPSRAGRPASNLNQAPAGEVEARSRPSRVSRRLAESLDGEPVRRPPRSCAFFLLVELGTPVLLPWWAKRLPGCGSRRRPSPARTPGSGAGGNSSTYSPLGGPPDHRSEHLETGLPIGQGAIMAVDDLLGGLPARWASPPDRCKWGTAGPAP